MENSKTARVTPEMRDNLLENRHGKLTTTQWKNIVAEPLVKLLILMIPGLVVLGPRLSAFLFGGMWLVGIVILVGLGLMLLARAIHFARIPLRFGIFRASDSPRVWWKFWRGDVLYNEANQAVRFGKRFAPGMPLQPGQAYLVYYIQESNNNILLSIAPANHDDAHRWHPTPSFQARSARRGSR